MRYRKQTLMIATFAIACVASIALAAGPRVGHTVNAFNNKTQDAITGKLVAIDVRRTNPLNPRFVWVKVLVMENNEPKTVEGWYELKPKPPRRIPKPTHTHSCCGGGGTSTSVTIVNNGVSNAPPDRYYRGPVYFSADNRNTNTVTVAAPAAPAPAVRSRPPVTHCPYCGMRPRYSRGRAYCPNGNGFIGYQ